MLRNTMTDDLTPICLVAGEPSSNAFSVKASSALIVDELKNLIKTALSPQFDDIAAKDLTLWRVTIPDDDDDDLPILFDSVSEKKKLKATTKLLKVFETELPDDTIHIIV